MDRRRVEYPLCHGWLKADYGVVVVKVMEFDGNWTVAPDNLILKQLLSFSNDVFTAELPQQNTYSHQPFLLSTPFVSNAGTLALDFMLRLELRILTINQMINC